VCWSLEEFCSFLSSVLVSCRTHDIKVSLCSQNGPLHLLQTCKTLIYMSTHSNCAVLSVSNAVRHTARLCSSLALQFTVGWNINTGLWNEHQTLTRKVVSAVLYPYNSDKTNAKKSEISTKIDVYSYRRDHRLASFSAGVICRGCG
jgi:hypothetical protein